MGEAQVNGMTHLEAGAVKVARRKGELLAKPFAGVGNAVRIDEPLLIIQGQGVQFPELRVGESEAEAMFQGLVRLGLIII
jgi:hypothetical protein